MLTIADFYTYSQLRALLRIVLVSLFSNLIATDWSLFYGGLN